MSKPSCCISLIVTAMCSQWDMVSVGHVEHRALPPYNI